MSISLVGFATRFNLLRRHATWALADTDHLNQYESILVKRSQILITWCQYGSILVNHSQILITWCQYGSIPPVEVFQASATTNTK